MAITDFEYHGEQWRRITYSPERKFCVGLDLGQAHDPTAIAIVEHHRTPLGEFNKDYSRNVITQQVTEYFDVRHLERLPLNTSYVDIASYVATMMARSPLREGAELIVDQSGVGRPVVDILRRAGLRLNAITITGGDAESYAGRGEWRVPKQLLVNAVDARLATKELRFSDKLHDAKAMQDELKNFRRQISATGHASFNARSGSHDDLILASALAVWWLSARKSRGEFSTSHAAGMI